MYLKRITVAGFKSFCDRVDFDFSGGVTGIVGPNGCGKSNVLDAFKWVLGEQSARSLRGRQMIDMIFNGSSTRKASSVAQVDLVFDNTDRTLPLDLDEVTVSRKLYRSGESEYLLNKSVARLKDVKELFLDTGVGIGAYSVIEQGRVDQLLQSSPQDRRVIFEEAAGVSKYKARRKEAERKLERTDQNLLRVADIIEEVEKRLRSVRLQASKARNFKEHEARLNELRSSFALAEFHRFSEQSNRLTGEVDRCTDRMTGLQTDIDRHEKDEAQLTIRLDGLVEEINEADNQLVRARSALAAHEERIESANKRAVEQRELLDRARDRMETDSRRLEESREELEKVQTSVEALQTETHGLHTNIKELNEEDGRLARELTEALAVLDDEKAGIMDLLRKSAQTHNEIIRLNTHRESLIGQKGRLAQRDAQLTEELRKYLEEKAQYKQRLEEVESLIAEQTKKLEEKRAEAARVNDLRQQLLDKLALAKEDRSALKSRNEMLHDLQRTMEGVGAGVCSLLDRTRRDAFEDSTDAADDGTQLSLGIVGLVADVFDVDVEHAHIIEAALGETDQHLVVEDSRVFLQAFSTIGELPGRLTVLGLDRVPPIVNERAYDDTPGVIARAVDLVRYNPEHDHLARHLLGRTIVVENLETALTLAREDVTGHRFVSRDGEVVEPDGRIRVGPPSSSAGLISRKSELRDIGVRLVRNEELIATLSDQLNRTQAEVGHLETVQQELRTSIYECNTARVEADAGLRNLNETIERLMHEQPLIAQEVSQLEREINEVHEKSEAGGRSLAELEQENKEREARAAEHQKRIDDIVARRREVQERLTQLRVQVGQLTEKRAAAAETVNTLRRAIRELEGSVGAARHDIEQCEARITEAEAAVVSARQEVSRLAGEIEGQETRCRQLRDQRESWRLELDGLLQAAKVARHALQEVDAERHKHEMALAETKVRRGDLAERVQDELGINLEERYGQYQPEEQDWEAVEAEIAELRRKMERLGNVNLDAINELEELEQRHEFLTGQRDDLAESRRQLEQLIDRLNQESEKRFRTTFDQIRENFRELFRKLFGGGRADIVLENPENVLDSGIEIVAQPPGKELQVISLMSGGEKSMTAIALLMSIFKSKPAPFAILDEVDAALDEANNDRFNRIIKEFVHESQFIVITHSKRTMSIADHLYGVTMQEPGISTRMCVQLKDAQVA
jgi:chromosome segregation protein